MGQPLETTLLEEWVNRQDITWELDEKAREKMLSIVKASMRTLCKRAGCAQLDFEDEEHNTGLCSRSRGHRPGTYHAGETCTGRRLDYIAGWNDRRENSGPYKRDKGTVGRYICKSIRDYYNADRCGGGCGDLPVEHKREFQKLYSDVLAEHTGRRAGVF